MANAQETFLTDIKHKKDLEKVEGAGDLMSIVGLDNIKQAIIRRIMTTPGSLAHRPTYGVGMKDFQNAPNSLETQRALAERLVKELPKDPRVAEVISLSVQETPGVSGQVVAIIKVKLIGYDEVVPLEIPFGEVL